MMEGVRRGGDRQLLHEHVRHHSAAKKSSRTRKTALRRLTSDPMFAQGTSSEKPEDYTGLSQRQTEEFLLKEIDPILDKEQDDISTEAGEVRV
jgi:adenylosuccinate lyase